jgi:Fe(3+) dicitrate transport protein
LGLTREDFNNTPLRRYAGSQADQMITEHFQFMARHLAYFSDRFDLTTTVYRNNFSRDWYKLQSVAGQSISNVLSNPSGNQTALNYLRGGDSPDNSLSVRSNSRVYYSQGIETIAGLNFDLKQSQHSVQIGVRLHQDEEDRFQFEDQYAMRNGTMILTTPGIPGTQANRIGSATALSIYIQDEITLNNFTFTPGVRFENIWFNNKNYGSSDLDRTGSNLNESDYTINEIVPGVGFTYRFNNQFTLISGIHKGFSPPSPGSSGDTRSEQSVNYELGFRFSDNRIRTEVIGFFNDYNNLLGSDLAAGGGSGTTAQFNAGEVRVFGVEVSSAMDFSDFLNLNEITLPIRANYTYTNATFQSDFQSNFGPWGSVSVGDEIPFIPSHQFNSSVGLGYRDFSFHLNMMYSPMMRTVSDSGSIDPNFATDSYFVADISTDYQVFTNVNLFMNIRNLFDQRYVVSDRPAGLRPGLPRTAMGGLRVTF